MCCQPVATRRRCLRTATLSRHWCCHCHCCRCHRLYMLLLFLLLPTWETAAATGTAAAAAAAAPIAVGISSVAAPCSVCVVGTGRNSIAAGPLLLTCAMPCRNCTGVPLLPLLLLLNLLIPLLLLLLLLPPPAQPLLARQLPLLSASSVLPQSRGLAASHLCHALQELHALAFRADLRGDVALRVEPVSSKRSSLPIFQLQCSSCPCCT